MRTEVTPVIPEDKNPDKCAAPTKTPSTPSTPREVFFEDPHLNNTNQKVHHTVFDIFSFLVACAKGTITSKHAIFGTWRIIPGYCGCLSETILNVNLYNKKASNIQDLLKIQHVW